MIDVKADAKDIAFQASALTARRARDGQPLAPIAKSNSKAVDDVSQSHPLVLVQVLRAIAAILVLAGHTQAEVLRAAAASGQDLLRIPLPPGGFGVDLFFCISGFIMVVSSARLFERPLARRQFLLRRAIRLVPLYWLVTLCYMPILMLGSRGYEGNLSQALLASLAFIPYPTYGAEGGLVFPLYTLGWSLNYEVFFYVLFSLFVVLPAPRAVIALCSTLLIIVLAGFALPAESTVLRFWSQPIILEFGLGALLGWAWLRDLRLSRSSAALVAIGALACVLIDPLGLAVKIAGQSTQNDFMRVLGWGLPAALLLLAAVLFERGNRVDLKPLSPIAFLGDCSYSLYLIHPFALLFIGVAWNWLHLERLFGWTFLGVVLMAGATGMAIISYWYIERPVTKWLRRHPAVAFCEQKP